MSGYSILERGGEFGCEGLCPLPADHFPLSIEQTGDQDLLIGLIAKGQRDQAKKGWSAADYNNLACAYFWCYGEEGKAKAIGYFGEALKKGRPSETQKKTIQMNLELIKVL